MDWRRSSGVPLEQGQEAGAGRVPVVTLFDIELAFRAQCHSERLGPRFRGPAISGAGDFGGPGVRGPGVRGPESRRALYFFAVPLADVFLVVLAVDLRVVFFEPLLFATLPLALPAVASRFSFLI